MRRARYDMKQVVCRNASCIGYSSNIARPGSWITFEIGGRTAIARVLGRIAETDTDGLNREGWLVVIRPYDSCTHAGVYWVDPRNVNECYETPPTKLLAWLTGEQWVKSKHDIARIIAMSEHGTLSEQFIERRDEPDQAYNARPEYIKQFILE